MARTSIPNMVGVPPFTADIGCSLVAWDAADKERSNRYDLDCMTAGGSVFDSRG